MTKVEHSNTASRDLVFVGGADAAASGSNFFARRAHAVHELVIREHQMCSIAYIQASLNIDAVGDQLIDFGEQRLGVEHDTISYRAPNAAMQNSARDLM